MENKRLEVIKMVKSMGVHVSAFLSMIHVNYKQHDFFTDEEMLRVLKDITVDLSKLADYYDSDLDKVVDSAKKEMETK